MSDDTKAKDQKDTKDSDKTDKPDVKPKDDRDSKADEHWQKIAEERRVENEKIKLELAEAKKSKDQRTELDDMKAELAEIRKEKEIKTLSEKYPDVESELLSGKTPEEQERLVTNQRKRLEERYQFTIDVNPPTYSEKDISSAVKDIAKNDPSESGAVKALKLLRLRK